jgi:rhodanese-related sulfurtransferase
MPVPRITKEDLKARLDATDAPPPVILDVRLRYPYEHSTVTLPNAVRVEPGAGVPVTLPKERDIVAYDSDPDELVSAPMVARLAAQGYRAWALKGGIAEWIAANLPVDPKGPPATAAAQGDAGGA